MAGTEHVTICLDAKMAKIIRSAVDAGEYTSTSEIIDDALRDWNDKRYIRQRHLEDLKASIQQGIDDIKAGRHIPAEQVFEELRARYRKPTRKRTR